jgi:hypothetical protein
MIKWKQLNEYSLLKDDETYLVRWCDVEGEYHQPTLAWWDAEEKVFFPLYGMMSWPLRVDEYAEI